jgi:hypothetical protein
LTAAAFPVKLPVSEANEGKRKDWRWAVRTVEVAPRGRRPPIRLRPAPPLDPPFDDELGADGGAGAGQLAFDWSGGATVGQPGRRPPATAAHRQDGPVLLVNGTAQSAGPAGRGGPRIGTAAATPEAKVAVRRFVAACTEVLNGYRPAAHLRRLARPRDAAGVVAQALAAAQRAAELRPAGTRSGHGPSRHGRRPDPVAVLKLQLCEPRAGAVEAAVLLVTGGRTWALALRLEQDQQAWSATALRLV